MRRTYFPSLSDASTGSVCDGDASSAVVDVVVAVTVERVQINTLDHIVDRRLYWRHG